MPKRFQIFICFCAYLFLLVFLPLAKADQDITVSGIVSPKPSDYSIAVTSNKTGTLSQNTVTTYTITYGGNVATAITADTTIVADFSADTPDGGITHVTDYVVGSATTAVSNTSPIVDLIHRQITWTIHNFDSHVVGQTVSFQLVTNTNYTASTSQPIVVKTKLYNSYVDLPFTTSTTYYQYASQDAPTQINPTVTPTTSPTSTPKALPKLTPIPTQPTPTETPPVASPALPSTMNFINLSDSNAQLALTTNTTGKVIVRYGTALNSLTGQEEVTNTDNNPVVTMNNLDPSTTYFMQVVTVDSKGRQTPSDVFTFQTATVSQQPQVAKTSVVISSDTDVLYSSSYGNSIPSTPSNPTTTTPQVAVAPATNWGVNFKLTKANNIATVAMIMKNISVLGANTYTPPPKNFEWSIPVTQKTQGVYTAQIATPWVAGIYDMFIRITDTDGNITQQKIAQVKFLKPFRAYSSTNNLPIEDVRIVISQFNSSTKKYDLLPNINGFHNPIYTNKNGEASLQLPRGMYRAFFGRIGYYAQTKSFTVGTGFGQDFPTVYLHPAPVTPVTFFNYYRNALFDYISATSVYIATIQQSNRFFDLIGLGALVCLITLSFLLFAMRSHIAFSHIPSYLHHHVITLLKFSQSPYVKGQVVEISTKIPIVNATVFLIDEKSKQIIQHTQTNALGTFLLTSDPEKDYIITVMKEGYEEVTHSGYSPDMVIPLTKGQQLFEQNVLKLLWEIIENSLGLFFEFFLVLTLLLEVVLFPAFGLVKTLPFLLLSLINVILWIFYLRESGKQIP